MVVRARAILKWFFVGTLLAGLWALAVLAGTVLSRPEMW